jgi:hypothetical protein
MRRLLSMLAVLAMVAVVCGGQTNTQDTESAKTERALATGLKPLKQIEICPPSFDGPFGTDPLVPSQATLMGLAEAKLKAGGVPYQLQSYHREALMDKTIMVARKTTAWLHLRVQVIALPDKKAYACRIVLQLQSPVNHPADEKQYVFANLYEDSKLILTGPDLTSDGISNGMSEIFGRFADRWALSHQ